MTNPYKSVKFFENAGFIAKPTKVFINVLVDTLEKNLKSIKSEIKQDIRNVFKILDKFI